MSKILKFNWFILAVLSLIVIFGTVGLNLLRTPEISLVLKKGETAFVDVIRYKPTRLSMEIGHERSNKNKRPELGEWSSLNKKLSNFKSGLTFSNPGLSVKILASVNKDKVLYEAMPVSSHSSTTSWRGLNPYIEDGDERHFNGSDKKRLLLLPFKNHLKLTVQEVAPELVNEKIKIQIRTPVGFKECMYGYEFWWFFYFWFLYAIILALYLIILLFFTYRHYKKHKFA